ncbi:MAG: squalene/phytoene synthase family protein [Anaerolineae bacterium]|nr:squalene/phytoene synthase family protein [Anaerolineae bacterium]
MSSHTMLPESLTTLQRQRIHDQSHVHNRKSGSRQELPAAITKAASKQTYYTVRFLVDRSRTLNAYRAYAYFRWVDDWLDRPAAVAAARTAFIERQQTLIDSCYRGERVPNATREERMLIDLLSSEPMPKNGLRAYIDHMMAVMRFDTQRRGQLVSGAELDGYTYHLAAAVTEALHYFIGHDRYSPQGDARYRAATGAHIAHMLRDTCEDIEAGYYNVPRELLRQHGITPSDTRCAPYRAWVRNRVEQARADFDAGRRYLAQVENLRCRIAGYAYIERFTGVLDAIEREGYVLRASYPERKRLKAGLKLGMSVLSQSFLGT